MRPRLALTFAAALLFVVSALLALGTVESRLPALDTRWHLAIRVALLVVGTAMVLGLPLWARRAWRRRRPTSAFPMGRLVATVVYAALVAAFAFEIAPGPAAALQADLGWLRAPSAPAAAADGASSEARSVKTTGSTREVAVKSAAGVPTVAPSGTPSLQRGERRGGYPRGSSAFHERNVDGTADVAALRAAVSDVPLVWLTAVPLAPGAGRIAHTDQRNVVPAPDGAVFLTTYVTSEGSLVGVIDADTGAWSGWRLAPASGSAGLTTPGGGGVITLPLHIGEPGLSAERDFVAYDVAKGTTRFRTTCKGPGGRFGAPGIASSGHLYIGCGEDVVALDAQDGHEVWRHGLRHAASDVVGPMDAFQTDVVAALPDKNLTIATIRGRPSKAPFDAQRVYYGLDATTGLERWHFQSAKKWAPEPCDRASWINIAEPWFHEVLGGRLRLVGKDGEDGPSWFQSFDAVTGALVWERRGVPHCTLMGVDGFYEVTTSKSSRDQTVWSVRTTGRDGSPVGTPSSFAKLWAMVVADDANLWALERIDVTDESYVTNLVRVTPRGTATRWLIGGDPTDIVDVRGGILTTREAYADISLGPVLARWRLPP